MVDTKHATVVALGVFDGVHLGHQELLREGFFAKKKLSMPLIAMSFHPHPGTLLDSQDRYTRLLTPPSERRVLLEHLGTDQYLSVPFTRDLSRLLPKEFATQYLSERLNARVVVCGFNFSFGYRGLGKPKDLSEYGEHLGFRVIEVPPYEVGESPASSTRVRLLLDEGNVKEANLLLGRPYIVTGTVVRGDGRGRKIGFPTCNIKVSPDKLLPGVGVYEGLIRVNIYNEIKTHIAVINIGTRPTFDGLDVRMEVHIPGLSGDFYSRRMQILFLNRLRDEKRFDNADSLIRQIKKDIISARQIPVNEALNFNLIHAYDRILASELP